MQYEAIRFLEGGPLAEIELARGVSGNLIDRRCLDELASAAETISRSSEVVAVLLRAAGPDFSRGWSPALRAELTAHNAAPLADPFGPLAALSVPLIAALQGRVTSAGLELALVCDIRIAASDAVFSQPETGDGLLPLAGASQRLPRLAGRGVALAMLLLGEELDAEAAYRCGLVSRVVAPAELEQSARALAARLAERGPLALRYAKEAVQRGLEMSLDQGLRHELDLSIILQTTADRAEGVRAFLEKRPPRFEGR
jgi:enoyl-CoA hydratase